jgi:hypothetical protein
LTHTFGGSNQKRREHPTSHPQEGLLSIIEQTDKSKLGLEIHDDGNRRKHLDRHFNFNKEWTKYGQDLPYVVMMWSLKCTQLGYNGEFSLAHPTTTGSRLKGKVPSCFHVSGVITRVSVTKNDCRL